MGNDLYNRIAVLRAERNLSRQDLADALGINYQTVGFLERGDYNPSLTLALDLSAYFGLPVEAIFSRQPLRPLSEAVYGDGAGGEESEGAMTSQPIRYWGFRWSSGARGGSWWLRCMRCWLYLRGQHCVRAGGAVAAIAGRFISRWRSRCWYLAAWAGLAAGMGLIKPFPNKPPRPEPVMVDAIRLQLAPMTAGTPDESSWRNDERELSRRDRAHYQAYQVVGGAVPGGAAAGGVRAAEWP